MPDHKVFEVRRISNAPILAADETGTKKLWVKRGMEASMQHKRAKGWGFRRYTHIRGLDQAEAETVRMRRVQQLYTGNNIMALQCAIACLACNFHAIRRPKEA